MCGGLFIYVNRINACSRGTDDLQMIASAIAGCHLSLNGNKRRQLGNLLASYYHSLWLCCCSICVLEILYRYCSLVIIVNSFDHDKQAGKDKRCMVQVKIGGSGGPPHYIFGID